jgi:antagonist of KipI
VLEVIEPGVLSTVQDAGRPWTASMGVPRSGACDPLALRVLQWLMGGGGDGVGAPAVLEMSLVGPTLAVREACVVGLSGADFDAEATDADGVGRPLQPGTTALLKAGTTLRFAGAVDGCRAYLGIGTGIDVPLVIGSRSTCLVGRFGGMDGRPLRAGDVLRPVHPGDDPSLAGRRWPGDRGGRVVHDGATVLRVVRGPHADLLGADAMARLIATGWSVSVRSDRMGIRLDGPTVRPRAAGELISFPVTWGAVQLPPTGTPIVLLADHQTVGGYPVPLVVASVDRPVLGQLRATDAVRLQLVGLDEARALHAAAEAAFQADLARFEVSHVG